VRTLEEIRHQPQAQPEGVRVRALVLVIVGLALGVVLVAAATASVMGSVNRRNAWAEPAALMNSREAGQAQAWLTRADELAQIRAKEDLNLHKLEWLDETKQRARIPIEQAMRMEAGKAKSAEAKAN
jgi:hypothetical protein